MTMTSRLALVAPLVLAMASPAAATQWLDFSVTFTSSTAGAANGTLTGRTATGDSSFGVAYGLDTFQNLQFSTGGPAQDVFLYDGYVVFSNGTSGGFRSPSNVSFNFTSPTSVAITGSPSAAFYFTLGEAWSGTNVAQEHFFWDPTRGLLSGTGINFAGSPSGIHPQTVAPTPGTFGTSANVAVVPEINGSGFAYIAFILGALGLWLYSGAGRSREEALPA